MPHRVVHPSQAPALLSHSSNLWSAPQTNTSPRRSATSSDPGGAVTPIQHSLIRYARRGTYRTKVHPSCGGRRVKPPNAPPGPARRTTPTTTTWPPYATASVPPWPSSVSCCARSASGRPCRCQGRSSSLRCGRSTMTRSAVHRRQARAGAEERPGKQKFSPLRGPQRKYVSDLSSVVALTCEGGHTLGRNHRKDKS